jgi:signal peptidase II
MLPGSAPAAPLLEKSLLFSVALLSITLDHLSKRFVEAWLPIGASWAPLPELEPLFRFAHVSNTGAAFGLLSSGSTLFGLIAAIVSAFIIYYNYRLPANQHAYRIALGLQMGGAIGNLVDRLRQGHVTDFLDFGPWPVFNLADFSIVAGVVLLGALMLRDQRAEAAGRREPAPDAHPAGAVGLPDDKQDAPI